MTCTHLQQAIQRNCDISDARDNSIYSICTLVLKLRNLFKWENNIEPWDEPDPSDILDWIDARENYWHSIKDESYKSLPLNGGEVDPYHVPKINESLADTGLVYGSGYGRSMKSIFFLAEKLEEKIVDGCPTIILGREKAKELASPFAMLQDGIIYIRKEPLRFYLWDQIQEVNPSGKTALLQSLRHYNLLNKKGLLDRNRFIEMLDFIVEQEMATYIYHEVGEMHDTSLDRDTLKTIISIFPDSPIEFLARAMKDILADTHPKGMLSHIVAERKEASLGFYVAFLDGLRKVLFPEIIDAFSLFQEDDNWRHIEQARDTCRQHLQNLTEKIHTIFDQPYKDSSDLLKTQVEQELLVPLGLGQPQ